MRTLSTRVLVGSWVMIAVLSVITLTLYVDNYRTRSCISSYMVVDQQATKERARLAGEERQFFKNTLVTMLTEPDREKRIKALNDYVALIDKNDQIRKENPIPEVPTECD